MSLISDLSVDGTAAGAFPLAGASVCCGSSANVYAVLEKIETRHKDKTDEGCAFIVVPLGGSSLPRAILSSLGSFQSVVKLGD